MGKKKDCDHVWIEVSSWTWSEPTPSGGNRENWRGKNFRCTLCGEKKVEANHKFLGFTRDR